MKQIFYPLLMLVLLISCKKEKTVNLNNEANKAKEVLANVSGDSAVPPMYKGMADDPNNVLGGLSVGDKVENFSAQTHLGTSFELNKALNRGPVLIVFYRGHWCPKCTKHLEDLEQNLLELKEFDLSVIAVTPESEEFIAQTVEKSSASFPIIYDKDESLMKKFKVFYKVRDGYVPNLDKNHGQSEANLPVPATYLIGESGEILYAQYDHDYGNRATARDIRKFLSSE